MNQHDSETLLRQQSVSYRVDITLQSLLLGTSPDSQGKKTKKDVLMAQANREKA